ncbi:unnamed protein product, partial [Ectocarpus sp. 12 AP-2014]
RLKGDPIRQIRKPFERIKGDEDILRRSAHYQQARHQATTDLT